MPKRKGRAAHDAPDLALRRRTPSTLRRYGDVGELTWRASRTGTVGSIGRFAVVRVSINLASRTPTLGLPVPRGRHSLEPTTIRRRRLAFVTAPLVTLLAV